MNGTFALSYDFQINVADDAFDPMLRDARRLGLSVLETGVIMWRGLALLFREQVTQALDVLTGGLELDGWSDEHDAWGVRPLRAMAAHLAGDHQTTMADATTMEAIHAQVLPRSGAALLYASDLLMALGLAGQGDIAGARDWIRRSVQRLRAAPWQVPLAMGDCLTTCAVAAYHAGQPERAITLLAALPINRGPAVRPPGLFTVALAYRQRLRQLVDRPTRERCIEQGKALTADRAIDSELTRWGTTSPDQERGAATAIPETACEPAHGDQPRPAHPLQNSS